MENTVGIRELKTQLSAYLRKVKSGDAITITEHGKPIWADCAHAADGRGAYASFDRRWAHFLERAKVAAAGSEFDC